MTQAVEVAGISIEDRLEILELFARYSWAVDTGDGAAYAAVFARDGVMEGGQTRIEGRDELRAFAERIFHAEVGTQHWTANHLIEATATGAAVRCYLVELEVRDGTPAVALVGCYVDALVKEDGEWRIAHRRFAPWGGREAVL